MKKILIFACAFLFVSSVVFAAPLADQGKKGPSPAQLAQQEKMKTCNADAKAKNLKGDERKKFMSECLKGKTSEVPVKPTTPPVVTPPPPSAKQTQQEKMKKCNADAKAKNLKGAERQKFMSECLKGEAIAPPTAQVVPPAPPSAKLAQQEKMKKCNADAKAKNLKGAERQKFMSDCLKADKK